MRQPLPRTAGATLVLSIAKHRCVVYNPPSKAHALHYISLLYMKQTKNMSVAEHVFDRHEFCRASMERKWVDQL